MTATATATATAERIAERCRHLEEMFVVSDQVMADQAQLIADQKAERDQLRQALSDALQVATDRGNALHARDARIAELEGQLKRERKSVDVLLTQRDTAERQAEAYAADAEHRGDLAAELNGARVIIEARDNRLAQLEVALKQRNQHVADATEAAEAYRMERDAARATIDAVGRLIDPQD